MGKNRKYCAADDSTDPAVCKRIHKAVQTGSGDFTRYRGASAHFLG